MNFLDNFSGNLAQFLLLRGHIVAKDEGQRNMTLPPEVMRCDLWSESLVICERSVFHHTCQIKWQIDVAIGIE